MVRRLIEADYHCRPRRPSRARISFWLLEARGAAFLLELCRRYPVAAKRMAPEREAVRLALTGDFVNIERALREEEDSIRAADHAYWQPLRAELIQMRRSKRKPR